MATTGSYLAARMREVGITDWFTVPGDYSFTLLDELLTDDRLRMICCSSELGAGYAADGYARVRGAAAVVTTFSVGALSAVNAIAGSYAEDVPVLLVSSTPPAGSGLGPHHLHHTLGESRFDFVRAVFEPVTAGAFTIDNENDITTIIDRAIDVMIESSKPVYLEIACNLSTHEVAEPAPRRVAVPRAIRPSDPTALAAAVAAIADQLSAATDPVLLVGADVRIARAAVNVERFVAHANIPTALLPEAKGSVDETIANVIGTYWAGVSTPRSVESVVDGAGLQVHILTTHSDYGITGQFDLFYHDRIISIERQRVTVAGSTFDGVAANDVLAALVDAVSPRSAAVVPPSSSGVAAERSDDAPLEVDAVIDAVQSLVTDESFLVVDAGNAWFGAMHLDLPPAARMELQLRYCSIGWSVGATLGVAAATVDDRRVIQLVGDGAFQMNAVELSTMLRYGLDPIIVLLNNGAYMIEVLLHDGPYNDLQPWKYAELVDVLRGDTNPHAWGRCVETVGELRAAIEHARATPALCLIECRSNREDGHADLAEFGRLMSGH